MPPTIHGLLSLYNPDAPLDHAYTIPAPWYRDPRIESLEKQSVFAGTWQVVGRLDQVRDKGDFFTADIAAEPIVVVRGDDNNLRAFFNVCRH
ncbi:MAG: Rieske 2Fe-2S domain-containing protein, partial [Acidobacteria bacterium]|nr:Rieske 2Fe-2S domain-containing protein [Acidobacteriota bacterium]